MDRVVLGAAFVQVTAAEDGTVHLVPFRLYEDGLISGEGRYATMCGKTVLAASMTTAPDRRCPLCRASRAPRLAPPHPDPLH